MRLRIANASKTCSYCLLLVLVAGCKPVGREDGNSPRNGRIAPSPTAVDENYLDRLVDQIDWDTGDEGDDWPGVADLRFRDLLLKEVPDGRALFPVLEDRLVSEDWGTANGAAVYFEFYPAQAIPVLVKMLDREERVKLQNTQDLIYPGAETYYGHGLVIDYDLEHLGIRAGWVLETITFQDFGFRHGAINEDLLFEATIAHGRRDMSMDEVTSIREKPADEIRAARANARAWWTANQDWTRLAGLMEALTSGNRTREHAGLSFIRFGRSSPCDGLTPDYYDRHIRAEVKRLADSNDPGVSAQAKLLLEDVDYWWWKERHVESLQVLFAEAQELTRQWYEEQRNEGKD